MSLEGRLRELGLAEVLQLLSVGRRSGTLHLHATLSAREATIVLDSGWIVDASESLHGQNATDARSVSERVLDLLLWTDGDFRFVSEEVADSGSRARIPTDVLLMEAARRADAWVALGARMKGPHEVPVFPDVQPAQLSLLHLTPDQWEILTRIDGRRTISELAAELRRDLVDVATTIHGLMEAGVLTLADAAQQRRTPAPTPQALPLDHVIAAPVHPAPLLQAPSTRAPARPPARRQTIPPVYSPVMPFAFGFENSEDDSLFDPMQVGVMTPDGMPATAEDAVDDTVVPPRSMAELVAMGDSAAMSGDLLLACSYWEQSLELASVQDRVDVVNDRITVARRLHSLLHS